jgi:hypothetical protein
MSFFVQAYILKKIKATGLIFLSLLFVFPSLSHAQYIDISTAAKDYGLDSIAHIVAQQAIQKLTAQTVNWINSGFKGNPAYITDPGQFFLDIADQEASRFLSNSNMNALCAPFRAEVRLALTKSYLAERSPQNFSCTLTKVKENFEQFTEDFSQGGWDSWFEVTQNSQNNPYGAYLEAKNSLSTVIGTRQAKYVDQLSWGQGFLSYEVCDGTKAHNNVTGEDECSHTKTVTPGSVINDQLKQHLGTGVSSLVQADEINEIVSALFGQLINKVMGSVGLLGASEPGSGSGGSSLTDDFLDESEDGVAPIITPHNTNPIKVIIGDNTADLGASAYDAIDGDISGLITITGMGDVTVPGTFTLTYNVTNSQGIPAKTVTRTVNVMFPGDPGTPPPPDDEGGGGNSGGNTTNFDFSLTGDFSQTVIIGSSTQATFTATLSSGSSNTVSFSATIAQIIPGLAGITWTPLTCTLPCSSTMTVGTSRNVPIGTYEFTITATAGDVTKTMPFFLNAVQ